MLVLLDGVTVELVVQLAGEVLFGCVRHVAYLRPGDRSAPGLRAIAAMNNRWRYARLRWNPASGEVMVSETLRIGDGELTAGQLHDLVRGLAHVALSEGPALRRLSESGDAGEQLQSAEVHQQVIELFARHVPSSLSRRVAAVPDEPIDEAAWLRLTVETVGRLTRQLYRSDDVTRAREEIWPRLQELRARSMEAGHDYRLPALAAEVEIGPAEEFVLLYMLGRQQQRQRAIPTEDILWVYAADMDRARADEVAHRLYVAELIVAADDDDMEPWRLGQRFLDPLAGRLPFAYEPLPPPYDPAELPAGPLAEPEWLALVHEVLRHQAADCAEAERLALLGERLWPALLSLRTASIDAGHAYQTAEARALFELDDLAELAVVYVAHRNATGRQRVGLGELRRLAGAVAPDPRELNFEALMSAGLLDACDGDEAAPWCLGEAGLAWRAA